jgi:hypothetical protein
LYLEVSEVDLGRGGDGVGLVHAAERNAVDFVRASDQQEATLKLLEEDHTLTAEAAGEQNEDGARGDRCAKFCGRRRLAALLRRANVLGRVEAGGLDGRDDTGRAVLRAADLDLLRRGNLLRYLLLRLLLALEEPALGEDLGAREAADAGCDVLGAGHLRQRIRDLAFERHPAGTLPIHRLALAPSFLPAFDTERRDSLAAFRHRFNSETTHSEEGVFSRVLKARSKSGEFCCGYAELHAPHAVRLLSSCFSSYMFFLLRIQAICNTHTKSRNYDCRKECMTTTS